jgi:Mn2+/Fe2+ NRAMP family transporter
LTVRLGISTQKGHAACIKQHFGKSWCWVTTVLLVLECVLAIISEMSGIAAVAKLWGVHRPIGAGLAAAMLLLVVFLCKYKQVETIGVALGMCELSFVVTMFCFHPSPSSVFEGMFTIHGSDHEYSKLIAANIGAVIMPWMIYFQQSAVVARRLSSRDACEERVHTFFGSCLTQLIMIATIVTFAAAKAIQTNLNLEEEGLDSMRDALAPVMGYWASMWMLTLAFLGGSLCAGFVVSLAAAWAISDAAGWDEALSLDSSPSEAPRFYAAFTAVVVLGMIILDTGIRVVKLNVFIELVDGLLMPLAVGFLFFLATSDLLPADMKVTGTYKAVLAILFSVCSVVSLFTGISGLIHDLR